jgi:hypothetical protein
MNDVWPHDFLSAQIPSTRAPGEFRVFIISRFEPKAWMDSVERLVRNACKQLETSFLAGVTGPGGKELDVSIRADRIRSAGIIHSEIWQSIAHSDVVVADISGLNANVMFELGAAAVRLPKERVILIREESESEEHAFDLSPVRHFRYSRSLDGIDRLRDYLLQTLLRATVSVMIGGREEAPPLPLNLTFHGTDSPWMYSPAECHRRVAPRWLEFGGLDYRQTFLSVGAAQLVDVRVEATVRFLRIFHSSPQNRAFVGVSVRAEHPLANFSNMLLVREDGVVTRTVPDFNPPNMYHDDVLDSQFGAVPTESVSLRLLNEIVGDQQRIAVNDQEAIFSLASDRRRPAGFVFVQAWRCVAGLESLSVTPLK